MLILSGPKDVGTYNMHYLKLCHLIVTCPGCCPTLRVKPLGGAVVLTLTQMLWSEIICYDLKVRMPDAAGSGMIIKRYTVLRNSRVYVYM